MTDSRLDPLASTPFSVAPDIDPPGASTDPLIAETPSSLWSPGSRRAAFVDLCAVVDVPPGAMRRVTFGDLDLLVAATPAGLLVTDDRCPHMAAPLSAGSLVDCVAECPLHRGRFDLLSGDAVQLPTTGGLDADGTYHEPWSPSGSPPKPEPPSEKANARRLTRIRRLRYYPARISGGRLEARIPLD